MGERPVVGAVELLDDLVLRRLLHVAEDLLDAPPVFEEVLLEERDDLALEAPDQLLRRGDVHQVAVSEDVVPVEQRLDPRVHRLQERLEVDSPEVFGKEPGPRHHLAEREAPPQRRVHEGDRAVGRVHRPDDEEVRRDGEALAAVGQLRLLLVPLPQPLFGSRSVMSSPNVFARFARLISSMTRTQFGACPPGAFGERSSARAGHFTASWSMR